MSIRRVIHFLLIALVPSIGFAQTKITGSPITGDRPVTRLRSDAESTNLLVLKLSASAIADDNNNNSAVHPVGGSQYYLAPALALQQSRSHLNWNLAYKPGVRFYVPSTVRRDQFSQLFGGTLHYDVSKRFSIGLRQDYLRTDDPFQQLGQGTQQPDIGILNRPGTVISPKQGYSSLLSEADLHYRLAKHTQLGINGLFTQTQYDHHQGHNENFINSRINSESAFLSHQITARQSIGMQYQLLNMAFRGDSRTLSHGVYLFDQIAVRPHITLSVFAGPQYSRIHNQEIVNLVFLIVRVPVSRTLWSPAAGATFSWSGERFAVEAEAVRRVADGHGLQTTVEMNSGTLNIRKTLARRWEGSLSAEITQDTLLGASGNGKLRMVNVGAGISHELAHKMWARLSYHRMKRTGGNLPSGLGNHNRLTLTLERDFNWPLGR
jgi:hypothetical protein